MDETLFIIKNAVEHFRVFRACNDTKSFDDCLEWAIMTGVPPRKIKKERHDRRKNNVGWRKCGK